MNVELSNNFTLLSILNKITSYTYSVTRIQVAYSHKGPWTFFVCDLLDNQISPNSFHTSVCD